MGYLPAFRIRLSFPEKSVPLGPYADIILYHHIYYRKLRDHDIPYLLVSQLLSLCDRLDVYQLEKPLQNVEAFLRQFEEDYFSKEAIDLFLSADKEIASVRWLFAASGS